jgi:hypothetical protein
MYYNYKFKTTSKKMRIITFLLLLSAMCPVFSRNVFCPGAIWPDNRGLHINAHGGGILYHEGR